jgi:hypothetical protein
MRPEVAVLTRHEAALVVAKHGVAYNQLLIHFLTILSFPERKQAAAVFRCV